MSKLFPIILLALFAQVASPPASRPPRQSKKTTAIVSRLHEAIDSVTVHITLFDHDKEDPGRTINLIQVVDDVVADDRTTVTSEQANRLLDVLANSGFFDRATSQWTPRSNRLGQPYYLITLEFSDDHFYEAMRPDQKCAMLLAQVRDALGKTSAGKTADRAAAAIDPKLRRWWPTTVPSPEEMKLPSATSPLHPDYSFVPIDPTWKISDTFIKVSQRGGTVGIAHRTGPDDDFEGWYRELTYTAAGFSRPVKTLKIYPSGQVCKEYDSTIGKVSETIGETHERTFSPGGAIISYIHSKDLRVVDAFTIDTSGNRTTVIAGHGMLVELGFPPGGIGKSWYHEGYPLVSHFVFGNNSEDVRLFDYTDPAHPAHLLRDIWGLLSLHQDGWQWDNHELRKTNLNMSNGLPHETRGEQLRPEYAAARKKFADRFEARVKAAGYTLQEMGVGDWLRKETPPSIGVPKPPPSKGVSKPTRSR